MGAVHDRMIVTGKQPMPRTLGHCRSGTCPEPIPTRRLLHYLETYSLYLSLGPQEKILWGYRVDVAEIGAEALSTLDTRSLILPEDKVLRLWSLHPRYLDSRGLVALWREALLAQAVLGGETRGYRHHPQLRRFLDTPSPMSTIATYLHAVQTEAVARGYRFNADKILAERSSELIPVTRGQLDYEWEHLLAKLRVRDPSRLEQFASLTQPEPHLLFRCVPGPVAEWEITRSNT